jgi:hypothetical protein
MKALIPAPETEQEIDMQLTKHAQARKTEISLNKNEYQEMIRKVANRCSDKEIEQLSLYLAIYKKKHCTEHWQVNALISKHSVWSKFDELRSHNTHESGYVAEGILPKYFAIICRALKISHSGGSHLLDAEAY